MCFVAMWVVWSEDDCARERYSWRSSRAEKRPASQDGDRSTELERTESAALHSRLPAGLGSPALRCCIADLFQIRLQLPRSRAAARGREAGRTAPQACPTPAPPPPCTEPPRPPHPSPSRRSAAGIFGPDIPTVLAGFFMS